VDYRLQNILASCHPNYNKLGPDRISVVCPHPSHPHNNYTPSLEVSINNKGGLSCVCHGNCSVSNEELWKWLTDEFDPEAKENAKKSSFIKSKKKGGPECAQWYHTLPTGAPELHRFPNTRYFQYMTKHGLPMGLVQARGEAKAGKSKTFTSWRYIATPDGETGWQPESPPDRIKPLYGLEQCVSPKYRDKPLLIVEGEKNVSTARKFLRDEYFILGWLGGSKTADLVDWDQLDWIPPRTVIWTDNDLPGFKWAFEGMKEGWNLNDVLVEKGHNVAIVDTRHVHISGWDIDDAIEAKCDIRGMISEAKPARIFRMANVYDRCQWSRDTNADEDSIASQTCADCTYVYCPIKSSQYVNKPQDLQSWAHHPERLEWVYSKEEQMLINMYSLSHLQKSAYSDAFAGQENLIGELYEPGSSKKSASYQYMMDPRSAKVDTLTFYPGKTAICEYKGKKCFNLWKDIIVPIADKEPTLWLQLMAKLFPDEKIKTHVFDYLAWTIQHPGKKINHGMLIKSRQQGIGKDAFIAPIAEIYEYNQQLGTPSNDELETIYQDYLVGNKLLIIQEVNARHPQVYNRLKTMCAAPPASINAVRKGYKSVQLPNIWSVIMFSNKDDPIKIEDDDRRWMVWECMNVHHHPDFFDDYWHEIQKGNLKNEIWHYLKRRDVSKFDYTGAPPETEAKIELKESSDPFISRIKEMIEDKIWPFNHDIMRLDSIRKALEMEAFTLPKTNQKLSKRIRDADISPYKSGVSFRAKDGLARGVFICRRHEMYENEEWSNIKDKMPESIEPPYKQRDYSM
jgi:Family of unknown function (DUF5906)